MGSGSKLCRRSLSGVHRPTVGQSRGLELRRMDVNSQAGTVLGVPLTLRNADMDDIWLSARPLSESISLGS